MGRTKNIKKYIEEAVDVPWPILEKLVVSEEKSLTELATESRKGIEAQNFIVHVFVIFVLQHSSALIWQMHENGVQQIGMIILLNGRANHITSNIYSSLYLVYTSL